MIHAKFAKIKPPRNIPRIQYIALQYVIQNNCRKVWWCFLMISCTFWRSRIFLGQIHQNYLVALILPSQFWQIGFESYGVHCSNCRILVTLRYSGLEFIGLRNLMTSQSTFGSQYAVKVRRHTPWSRVRCHGSHEGWFTHRQSISFATAQSSHNSEIYNIGVHAQ